ncbi:MAG TPA: hypothetical protein VIR03_04130 [Candidatus Saccharimonadales bacterium]
MERNAVPPSSPGEDIPQYPEQLPQSAVTEQPEGEVRQTSELLDEKARREALRPLTIAGQRAANMVRAQLAATREARIAGLVGSSGVSGEEATERIEAEDAAMVQEVAYEAAAETRHLIGERGTDDMDGIYAEVARSCAENLNNPLDRPEGYPIEQWRQLTRSEKEQIIAESVEPDRDPERATVEGSDSARSVRDVLRDLQEQRAAYEADKMGADEYHTVLSGAVSALWALYRAGQISVAEYWSLAAQIDEEGSRIDSGSQAGRAAEQPATDFWSSDPERHQDYSGEAAGGATGHEGPDDQRFGTRDDLGRLAVRPLLTPVAPPWGVGRNTVPNPLYGEPDATPRRPERPRGFRARIRRTYEVFVDWWNGFRQDGDTTAADLPPHEGGPYSIRATILRGLGWASEQVGLSHPEDPTSPYHRNWLRRMAWWKRRRENAPPRQPKQLPVPPIYVRGASHQPVPPTTEGSGSGPSEEGAGN